MEIRAIFRKAARSQIDWPLVGVAGGMAGLLVLSTTMTAWVASRSVNSVSRAARSPIGRGECSAGARQSVGDVRSHAERGNEELVQQVPAASYPEGDEQAAAPGASSVSAAGGRGSCQAARSNGSAGASPSRTEQKGEAGASEQEGAKVAFAKDPMEAAALAKKEHKLMFVLHVSGNFEESKFT